MNDIKRVERYFNEFVDSHFLKKPELITVFKNHSGKNKCIRNITKELDNPKYFHLIADIKMFKEVVESFTRMFCFAVINEKEKSLNSNHKLVDEFGNLAKSKETLKEVEIPDGVIEVERHPNT